MNPENLFFNKEVVIIASALIIFLIFYATLSRTRLGEQKPIVLIISFAVTLLSISSVERINSLINNFGISLTILFLGLVLCILITFFKFSRSFYEKFN